MPRRTWLFLCIFAAVATAAPAQRLNEILYDPHPAQPPAVPNGDANGDGFASASQDEFVEIYNPTPNAVALDGWTLSDDFEVRHVFAAGTVLPSRCVVVVFAGGVPAGAFGNALVQTASTGDLSLTNAGDTVSLRDATGRVVSSYTYRFMDGSDESLTRDLDGSNLEPLVPHTRAGGAVGVHSPGTRVDGTPFPGCGLAVVPGTWTQIKRLHR